ncbi:MAG: leucine-rich repeat protein [Clostridia bacterium]|nr:leucine-rich repeat protein [Clostridia bacterium]
MKKFVSLVLAFVFVIGIFASAPMAITANAASVVDSMLSLNEETNTYSFYNCPEDFEGELVIPDSYKGKRITKIEEYAFFFCSELTSVTISDYVTEIGESAFSGCYNLKSVKLPNGIESIKSYTFDGCYSLEEIVIPSSVTKIADNAFMACSGLKNVVIPKSVKFIDCAAFDDYDSYLFENVYYEGTKAEWDAITITDESDFGEYVDRDLSDTRYMHYNSAGNHSVATVIKEATCGKRGMVQYTCACGFVSKEFVDATGEHNFDATGSCTNCSLRKEYCVETAHPYNKVENFNKTIEIPGANRINISFSEDSEIFNGQYLMLIGDDEYETFLYSDEMAGKTFVIPGDSITLKMYGTENIYGDDAYDEDYYGFRVSNVESFFEACPHKDVKIQCGWEADCLFRGYEGDYYCYDCGQTYEGEYYAKLPHNFVNDICTECNSHVWEFYTEDGMSTATLLEYNGGDKVVTIPDKYEGRPVTEIYEAFYGNETVEEVKIPNTVTDIGYKAFVNCTALKTVNIPDSVTKIGAMAFMGCTSLKSITIPGSVKTISDKALGYDFSGEKIPLFKIFGTKGSAAETYAKENGFDFIGSTSTQVKLGIPAVKVANTAKGIKVTWNKIANAEKYVVYQRTYNAKTKKWSGWKALKTTTGLSYVDTTTKLGTYYSYTVRAVKGSAKSSFKATKGLKYDVKPTVTVANASNGIKVSWSTVANATGYTVYSSTYNSKTKKWSSWKNRGTTKANAKSWVDKSAKKGTIYKYTVRARYGSAASSFVASASLVRLLNPTVKVAKASNGVKVTWNKIAGAKNYKIYRAQYVNGKWSGWSAIKTTDNKTFAYVDKTAKKGVYYKYTVRAVNGKSASAFTASKNVKR